jgi:hypothetical protein
MYGVANGHVSNDGSPLTWGRRHISGFAFNDVIQLFEHA